MKDNLGSHIFSTNAASSILQHNRTKKYSFLLILFFFLLNFFLAQLTITVAAPIAYILLALSVALLILLFLRGSRYELFIFLYIMVSMRIIIPVLPQRELSLIFPALFLGIAFVRFLPKFFFIHKKYLSLPTLGLYLFFAFCLIGVFNHIQVAGLNSTNQNSGLLNRFNLVNSIIAFFCGFALFDIRTTHRWIEYFFKFNLVIMLVSMIVILFDIGTFPFFNTFTWSLIIEGNDSKKMIIAGISAASVLVYTLVYVGQGTKRIVLLILAFFVLLISGSRIFFLSGVLMVFIYQVVKARIFGKSILVLSGIIVFSAYLLTTPLILLIPEKYQRLVVVFPPQYYTGKLAHLSESAAAASTSFRMNIWGMAVDKIKEHPVIGNGFQAPQADYNFKGNILEGFQKIPAEILENDFLITGNLHNTFFSIAYLFGIPAFLFFFFFFTRLIWLHYKKSTINTGDARKVALFTTFILVQYFITTLTSDVIYDLQFFFTLAIAVKVYLFYYKSDHQQPETN